MRVNRHISEPWPEPIEPGCVRVGSSEATQSDSSRFNSALWHSDCCDALSSMESRQEAGCSRPKVCRGDTKSIPAANRVTENSSYSW